MASLRHLLKYEVEERPEQNTRIWTMFFFNEKFPEIIERKYVIEPMIPIQDLNKPLQKEEEPTSNEDVEDDIEIPIVDEIEVLRGL